MPKLLSNLRQGRSFDCLYIFPYNQAMIDTALRAELKNALIKQELSGGGWSYRSSTSQAALEPTCLALLALRWDSSPARALGLEFLLGMQNRDGSWPAFSEDDSEGSPRQHPPSVGRWPPTIRQSEWLSLGSR